MTDGLYLRPRKPAALLQYLLDCFASSRATRALLLQPRARGFASQATCFCHRRTIDIGFVCSVCLSVFCSRQAECLTCGTAFGKAAAQGGAQQAPLGGAAAAEPAAAGPSSSAAAPG